MVINIQDSQALEQILNVLYVVIYKIEEFLRLLIEVLSANVAEMVYPIQINLAELYLTSSPLKNIKRSIIQHGANHMFMIFILN